MSAGTGNRSPLPPDPLKKCASCLKERGNRRKGWEPILRAGQVVGWTCQDCPRHDEPIRREERGGRVRYLAVVSAGRGPGGKQRQHKRRHDRLEDARAWVEATRAGVARQPDYADPSRLTVQAIADAWLKARAETVGTPGGPREVTITGYRSALTGPLMILGHQLARDVTVEDIEACLRRLASKGGVRGKPLSHRSCMYSLLSLRSVFKFAVRKKWLPANPAEDATAPKEWHEGRDDDAARLRWTREQVVPFREHVLATYSDGPAFAAEPWVVVGMLCTLSALRRSEVLALGWRYVDRKQGSVKVRASRVKTGRGSQTAIGGPKAKNSPRTVPLETMHAGAKEALQRLWMAQGQPKTGLIIKDAAGQPVTPDHYSRRFRALCKEAGVPALVRIHNLRHTVCTDLSDAGLPDYQIAAILGVDVAVLRKFYLTVDDDGAAKAAVAVGRLYAV